MSHEADIIPIMSRRSTADAVPEATERQPPKGALALLVVILGLGAVGLLFTLAADRVERSIAGLSPSHRTEVFRRAYDDLRETCRLPEAHEGPVQEHCRNTASFVLLFPDCDKACGEAARALLPHARR
ncbi:MAG TPA: hypothetical protein VMT47_16125 [Polyangia bacterium]|nr:hypothetical protein [Polyangia bacterium]